jgi:hypothetical protein
MYVQNRHKDGDLGTFVAEIFTFNSFLYSHNFTICRRNDQMVIGCKSAPGIPEEKTEKKEKNERTGNNDQFRQQGGRNEDHEQYIQQYEYYECNEDYFDAFFMDHFSGYL